MEKSQNIEYHGSGFILNFFLVYGRIQLRIQEAQNIRVLRIRIRNTVHKLSCCLVPNVTW